MAHRLLRPVLLLILLALATPPSTHSATTTAVQAPVLKWAYGGCTSFCQTGWYSSPAVANLDADPQVEVIWGSYDVVSVNGSTGTLEWRATSGQRVWPAVAVADLTGDGALEVIVGRGGDQVTVYNGSGGTVWSRNPFGGGEVRTLAVADLEDDGSLEVIVGRASGGATKQLNVFNADGNVRDGWPARRDADTDIGFGWGMYNENVVVADFDGDGFREVIGPTDTHYITGLDRNGNQLPVNSIYGPGEVWSQVGVHVDQAADLRGFANCGSEHRPNFANSAPITSDLDGDGTFELVVVGDVYNCDVGDPDGDMYLMPWILNLDRTRWKSGPFDWTVLPPDPGTRPLSQDFDLIQNNVNNAVTADLDGDGYNEILFPSYDGRLYAYSLNKTLSGSWPFDVPGSGIRFAAEPAVVDVDNDGYAEVIFTSWPENGGGRIGQLHILDYLGNQLAAVDLPAPRGGSWNGGLGAPTVANVDGDADLEIVVGTVSSGVVAYDLPGSASARILWGTGRGNMQRNGIAELEKSFGLRIDTSARAIQPGDSTIATLHLSPGEGGSGPVTLSASITPPGPTLGLSSTTATPPQNITLTMTDQHPAGPLIPGILYTIEITAIGDGQTRTRTMKVLVGGSRIMLPFVVR